jgi:hypothetical protein
MIKLTDLLKELFSTPHYKDRKVERGNILDITLSKEAYGEYDINEAKSKIISNIKNELDSRLQRLENSDIDASKSSIIGYKIIKPILVNKNNEYPITITAEYIIYNKNTKKPELNNEGQPIKKKSIGTLYYGIINDNKFITLLIEDAKNDKDLELKMLDHLKREQKNLIGKPIKILTHPNFEHEIDIDDLFGNKEKVEKEIPTENTVDYVVRTDYRKGADFVHETYGKGTIVTTSTGAGGKGDTNGKLDWVDVDFGKPYVSKGQLQTVRRIGPVFTKVYFDTQKKK